MASPAVNAAFTNVATQVGAQAVDPQAGKAIIAALYASNKELRVWVDTANNYGHHSTTMNILKRMVEYGFKGDIRVFIEPTDAKKLEIFLPGYKPNLQTLPYKGATLRFHYSLKKPTEQVPLLICGGSEVKPEILEERRNTANCAFFLQLQPWRWSREDRLLYAGGRAILLALAEELGRGAFTFRAYKEPQLQRDDAYWDLYRQRPAFPTRVDMAKLLADAIERQNKPLLLPAYGLASHGDKWAAALTLTLGCLQAQDIMEQRHMAPKSIVLPIFDELTPAEWQRLKEWAEGTSNEPGYPPAVAQCALALQAPKRLGFQFLDDVAMLKDQLAYLTNTNNRLLVVSMPKCPDEIFRYFYGAATLPCVFEGRGTQNIVLNLGRPYLCTNPIGYPGEHFDANCPPEAQKARTVAETLCERTASYTAATAIAQLPSSLFATALCDLLEDQTAVAYFGRLGQIYGNDRFDKLCTALRYLRSVNGWAL